MVEKNATITKEQTLAYAVQGLLRTRDWLGIQLNKDNLSKEQYNKLEDEYLQHSVIEENTLDTMVKHLVASLDPSLIDSDTLSVMLQISLGDAQASLLRVVNANS